MSKKYYLVLYSRRGPNKALWYTYDEEAAIKLCSDPRTRGRHYFLGHVCTERWPGAWAEDDGRFQEVLEDLGLYLKGREVKKEVPNGSEC